MAAIGKRTAAGSRPAAAAAASARGRMSPAMCSGEIRMPSPTPSLAVAASSIMRGPAAATMHGTRRAGRRTKRDCTWWTAPPTSSASRHLPGQQRGDDGEVVAHLGHRLRRVEPEHPLVDVAVAGTDAEREAPAGQLVEVEGGERRGLRRPGVGVGDVRADPDRRRRRGDRGHRHEHVVHALDAVDGVDADRLGPLGQRDASAIDVPGLRCSATVVMAPSSQATTTSSSVTSPSTMR